MNLVRFVLPILFLAAYCFSNPARNVTFPLKQPDGTTVQVRQVGDEYFHFYETTDGYILQEDEHGFYAYAGADGKSSGIYARNAGDRNHADKEFLSSLNERTIYEKMLEDASRTEKYKLDAPMFSNSPIMRLPEVNRSITQGDVRVLVVLVEYADVKFKSADPKTQFNDFLNKEGYNEYYNIGSVRDYFIKSSNGVFRPTFDVYGPVTVSGTRASYSVESTSSLNSYAAKMIIYEALDMMKDEIDFSLYDKDGNDWVDYIGLIYAGVGSNGSGVKEAIWPHSSSLDYTIELGNGKSGYRYACANEINVTAYYYDETTDIIEGIGTMAHEFSHALGLPDLYNTKYNDGWDRGTPSVWDVMDQGSHNCPDNEDYATDCAPPLYSAFERISLNWLSPVELDFEGSVKLDKIEENVAYQITNKENPDEFFLLEYRTNKGWEYQLPNSGLLIWHIDYLPSVWRRLTPNNDRSHLRVDIVEAGPDFWPRESNSFPGSDNVTEFDQFVFWNGQNMNITLSDISESEDKEYVTFNVRIESSSSVESSSSENLSSSEMESSSSEPESSSSSDAESSSSEEPSSSSEESSSSSESESSSSEMQISSSEEYSSSSETASSSSEEPLSSCAPESSSSEQSLSSSEESSSSSDVESSSSEDVESSSSEGIVGVSSKILAQGIRVNAKNGAIYVYAPQQGRKMVRIFLPIGSLLLERAMDGSELVLNGKILGKMSLILSVSQGNRALFTGTVNIR